MVRIVYYFRTSQILGSILISDTTFRKFFNQLKSERIKRATYDTSEEAYQDDFNYIELLYNPKRKQGKNGMLPLINYERQ